MNTSQFNIKTFSNYWATFSLISINVSVFSFYGFNDFDGVTLIKMGGNFPPYSLASEPYRFITSMFLHGSFFHLLANMYSLFYLGLQTEKSLGSVRFLGLYFITGLFAGLSSVNFNLFEVSVGASGAIFGIYGYLIVKILMSNPANRVAILMNFIVYIVIVTFIGSKMNFDNAAHYGGVISGILFGLLYARLNSNWVFIASLLLLLTIKFNTPNFQVHYFDSYQYFKNIDYKIQEVLNERMTDSQFYDTLSKMEHLPDLVILGFQSLDQVPIELREDTTAIIQYMHLTNQKIQYIKHGISKESFIYRDSIEWINYKIALLPKIKYPLNLEKKLMKDPELELNPERLTFTEEFYDSSWFKTDNTTFEFYRFGQKDSLGDWHGRVEDYYASGAIQMKGTYQRGLKDGIFIFYEEDSSYSSAGRYIGDNREGKWENYHGGNILASEVRFHNGFSHLENTWDTFGKPLIVNGEGDFIELFEDGKISYRATYRKGRLQGLVEGYYQDGNIRYKEIYDNGELIRGISFQNNATNHYDLSTYLPYPSGGFEKFYKYLDYTNKMKSDTIELVVVLRFDVDLQGRINNIRFMKRAGLEYDNYALKLLKEGPIWFPAKLHGLEEITTIAEVTIDF